MKIYSLLYFILFLILLVLAVWNLYAIFTTHQSLLQNIVDVVTVLLTIWVSIVCFSKATRIE